MNLEYCNKEDNRTNTASSLEFDLISDYFSAEGKLKNILISGCERNYSSICKGIVSSIPRWRTSP